MKEPQQRSATAIKKDPETRGIEATAFSYHPSKANLAMPLALSGFSLKDFWDLCPLERQLLLQYTDPEIGPALCKPPVQAGVQSS